MHSVMMIAAGLITLAIFAFAGKFISGQQGLAKSIMYFLPVWLVVSLINMSIGVVSAGYTILQEVPFLLIVFGVPALAAWALRKWVHKTA